MTDTPEIILEIVDGEIGDDSPEEINRLLRTMQDEPGGLVLKSRNYEIDVEIAEFVPNA